MRKLTIAAGALLVLVLVGCRGGDSPTPAFSHAPATWCVQARSLGRDIASTNNPSTQNAYNWHKRTDALIAEINHATDRAEISAWEFSRLYTRATAVRHGLLVLAVFGDVRDLHAAGLRLEAAC